MKASELIKLLSEQDPNMEVFLDVEETHHSVVGIWISQLLSGKDKGTKYICIEAYNQ
jgi:hypothetical protein